MRSANSLAFVTLALFAVATLVPLGLALLQSRLDVAAAEDEAVVNVRLAARTAAHNVDDLIGEARRSAETAGNLDGFRQASEANGERSGLIVADLKLDHLAVIWDDVSLPATSVILLVDARSGSILTTTTTAADRIGQRLDSAAFRASPSGLDGDVFRAVSTIDELPWRVVVETPASAVVDPLYARAALRALQSLALALLTLGMLLILWRRLTGRLSRLQDAAVNWGASVWTHRAGIEGHDELARLGTAFDQMAEHVEATVHQMEEQAETLIEQAHLLELAHDAILAWDLRTGTINFWSRGAEALYGWKSSEAVGQTLGVVLQTRFARPLAEINAELLRTRYWEGELIHTKRDGEAVVVNSRWAVQEDKHQQPVAVLAINRDVSERKRAEAALVHQARHDGLTGLPIRAVLHDRLDLGVTRACLGGERLGLLLLDLDRFKQVNDTLGHHAGDDLLREVATRLAGAVRPTDLVARLGGDEFAVLLPGTDRDGAISVGAKLLRVLEAPMLIDGHVVTIGASIGITNWESPHTDASTMLRRADVAMYVAKRTGSGYVAYSPELDQHSRDRLELIAELRTAIEGQQLRLQFQPVASLDTNQVVHVEALVCWEHAERGLLTSDQFVPLAEQTGLIVALDRWVLGAALDQCRAWCDEGLAIPVAVNLSAPSLQDVHLTEFVTAELSRTSVPARLLVLELTETTIMVDPERVATGLRWLREQGVSIAIDDFGAGDVGFSYLRFLAADQLKISPGFVRDMVSNPADAVIVRTSVDLARGLGLEVVAEGIEDSATWNELARLGCHLGQGAFICRPSFAAELRQHVALPLLRADYSRR